MWGGSVSLPRQKSQFYFHIKYCNEFWSPTSCKLKAPYPRTFTIQRAVESEEKLATIGVSPGAQIMPLSSLVLPLIALPFVPSSLLLPGVKILQYLDWMNWLDTWWNSPNHLLYAQPRLLAGSFYVSPVDSQRVEMLNEKLPDFPEVKAHHLRSCLEKNICWSRVVGRESRPSTSTNHFCRWTNRSHRGALFPGIASGLWAMRARLSMLLLKLALQVSSNEIANFLLGLGPHKSSKTGTGNFPGGGGSIELA